MREEFEKWIKEKVNLNDSNLWIDKEDNYGYPYVRICWEAYQAGYRQCEDHKKGIR